MRVPGQQCQADLARLPCRRAGEAAWICRTACGVKTRSPQAGHSKISTACTVKGFSFEVPVQSRTTARISVLPHVGQTGTRNPPLADSGRPLRRDEEVEVLFADMPNQLPFRVDHKPLEVRGLDDVKVLDSSAARAVLCGRHGAEPIASSTP